VPHSQYHHHPDVRSLISIHDRVPGRISIHDRVPGRGPRVPQEESRVLGRASELEVVDVDSESTEDEERLRQEMADEVFARNLQVYI